METTEQVTEEHEATSAEGIDLERVRDLLLAGNTPEMVAVAIGIPRTTLLRHLKHKHNLVPHQKTVWELVPWRKDAEQPA